MGTPFKFTIDICQPDKGTYAKIVPSQGANTTIWADPKCGGCPFTEEELKATCPNPEDRVKIYAYESISQYEAENEQEKIQHQQSLGLEPYIWLFDSEKCLECESEGMSNYCCRIF